MTNYIHICLWRILAKFTFCFILWKRRYTGTEVDDEVDEKDSVRDAIEDDPVCTQIVVEEWYGDRKYDNVGNEQHEHEQIPVEPSQTHLPVVTCCYLWSLSLQTDNRGTHHNSPAQPTSQFISY